jgi:hypothetical protein
LPAVSCRHALSRVRSSAEACGAFGSGAELFCSSNTCEGPPSSRLCSKTTAGLSRADCRHESPDTRAATQVLSCSSPVSNAFRSTLTHSLPQTQLSKSTTISHSASQTHQHTLILYILEQARHILHISSYPILGTVHIPVLQLEINIC